MTLSKFPVALALGLLLTGCGADVVALQDPQTFTVAADASFNVGFGARDSAQCPASAPTTVEIKSTGGGNAAGVKLVPGKDGVVYFLMERRQTFHNETQQVDAERYFRVGTYTAPAGGLKKDATVAVKLDDGVAYETVLPRFNMASCTHKLTFKTLPAAASPAPELVKL